MEHLNLPLKYEDRVRLCFDVITRLMPGSEIYLFGNYAKGFVEKKGIVNLLVLIGMEHSVREIHRLRLEIEDMIYRINDGIFQIELIILPEALYKKYVLTSSKLKQVEEDKRDLRYIHWH